MLRGFPLDAHVRRLWQFRGSGADSAGAAPLAARGAARFVEGGVSLDGATAYLDRSPDSALGDLVRGELTVEALVRLPPTWSQVGPIFEHGAFGGTPSLLALFELDQARRPRFRWKDADGVEVGVSALDAVPTGADVLVAAVRRQAGDGSWEAELWIGAERVAQATGLPAPAGGSSPDGVTTVGAKLSAAISPLFEGTIGGLRVSDVARSSEELGDLVALLAMPFAAPRRLSVPPKRAGLLGLPSKAVTAVTSIVRASVEELSLSSKLNEIEPVVAWGKAARSWVSAGGLPTIDRRYELGEIDLSAGRDWLDRIGDVEFSAGGEELGRGNEPFLDVRVQIGETRLRYSDIDRPVGSGSEAAQLDGRVLDLGYAARRFSPDRIMARTTATIRLRNYDRELDRFFRTLTNPNASFLLARVEILVGFRHLPPRHYRPVGGGWYIDRVNRITADFVELTLVDRTSEVLGKIKTITYGDYCDAIGRRRPTDGSEHDVLPVGFGSEWVRPKLIHLTRYGKGEWHNALDLSAIVGVSRNPDAIPPETWLSDTVRGSGAPWWFGYLIPDSNGAMSLEIGPSWPGMMPIPSQSDGGRLYAVIQRIAITVRGDRWYVARLYMAKSKPNPPPGLASWERSIHDRIYRWVHSFAERLEAGNIFVKMPWGAEGPRSTITSIAAGGGGASAYVGAWSGGHDPASIMQEIAARYMGTGAINFLDAASFQEVRDARGEVMPNPTIVAGSLASEEEEGSAVLGSISASYDLDLWWGADGKAHVRTPGISPRDLTERIPRAIVYDARWDIVRGSWEELLPLGSERWGAANTFRFQGLKDYTSSDFQQRNESNRTLLAQHGRILEKDLDLSWWDTSNAVGSYSPISTRIERYGEQHSLARFRVPLYGLENELGDYVRVSHWAGFVQEGGYVERLFRIEEIGLDWKAKQVEIVALDMGALDEFAPPILDDEDRWTRFERRWDNGTTVTLTEGLPELVIQGPEWELAQVGDLVVVELPSSGEVLALRIEEKQAGKLLVDEAPELGGTFSIFKVQRTHADPPRPEEFPGAYPLGPGVLFRACDEELPDLNGELGAFPDLRPGFRAVED